MNTIAKFGYLVGPLLVAFVYSFMYLIKESGYISFFASVPFLLLTIFFSEMWISILCIVVVGIVTAYLEHG